MRIVFIVLFLGLCMSVEAQDVTSSDSLNIPVLLVDGVEVQSLDSISAEDIIDFKVIKDEEVKKLSPCGDKFLKPHKSSSSSIPGV